VTLMVLFSMAAFTALIWWNAAMLNRADQRRRKAESELQQAHDELEQRVEARTADLSRVNESLRGEIAERKKAEQEVQAEQEQRKKIEEQFLRSQRMESLGALAGGIAHDLNNALVPVLLGSQLLREGKGNESNREKILDLISTSAQRCTDMVKQIVSFARDRGRKASSCRC